MKRKYVIGIDGSGIDDAIKGVKEYQRWIERKSKQLAKRLAELGATAASLNFSRAIYTGPNDYEITVEQTGETSYTVHANGNAVLFIEFGAGATYGYGHPEVGKYGPGTWPYPHYRNVNGEQVANWENPSGWWLPKEAGGGHTYGNPPNMPMYNAVKDLREDIGRIAKEVFNG